MSETFLRQWAMLRAIPRAPKKIDAGYLKRKLLNEGFDINLRTIQRDLKTLSSIFPLTSDERDKPYGWSWMGNEVFDIPGMDPPTALTFSLASQFLEPLLPRTSYHYLEPHFRQAKEVLKQASSRNLGKWPDKVRILPRIQRLQPAETRPEVLDAVYEALLSNKRLKVYYTPRHRESREYELNPLGLVFRDAAIYLVCSAWDYDDIKQFALHRITEAQILDVPRRMPPDFDLDDYIEEEFDYPVSGRKIRLKVLFSRGTAMHLYETPLSPDQKLTEVNEDEILVEATVLDSAMLRWWLLGFGDQVEVLKPKRLREEFKEIAQNMSFMY